MLKPFFVWQDKKLMKIKPEDVMCLYTEGNYTKIILSNKTFYMIRSTLENALEKLPSDVFIQIHRSFAVSIYYVDTIEKDHLTMGEESIPVTKQYYDMLGEKLNIIE